MRNTRYLKGIVFILFVFSTAILSAQVRLPVLISDGMVLQRNAEVNIWGWSAPGEKITVKFIDLVYSTQADSDGNWTLTLSDLEAGGPYTMLIKASNEVKISDILIGDVWLCSGQSNMELPMRRVSWLYKDEIENCANKYIRQFLVPDKYDFNNQQTDLPSGSWKSAGKESIMDYSAVAYFYAKALYSEYNIPVGIINASLGGSPIQAWMSEESLKQFPEYFREMQQFKDTNLISEIFNSEAEVSRKWYSELHEKDLGYGENSVPWFNPDLNTSTWKRINVPGYWYGTDLENINGVVWFRRKFSITPNKAFNKATLVLGRMVDADSVFINGKFVGTTSYLYPPRRYSIPEGVLKEGENSIVMRIISNNGVGGVVPDKPYEIQMENDTIDLKGAWSYKIGASVEPLASQTFVRWKSGGLFNAMIAPLQNYRVKGVIWYQGESNTDYPQEYSMLFNALIKDWRIIWNQEKMPFIYVQLPNFMEAKSLPSESNWALFREEQLKALAIPHTAMAVAIDLGEWNDIHPLNKKDVGERLFLASQQVAYGNNKQVSSGPMYQSMRVEGNKIILSFNNIGSGLIAKNGPELKEFAIAGADKKFVWAKTKIIGDEIIVWNEKVKNPLAVRYAWADNPAGANLYNKEGLPASPFRTDNWKPGN